MPSLHWTWGMGQPPSTTRGRGERRPQGEIIRPALHTRRSNLDYELAISGKSIFKPGNRWWRARGAHNPACDERLGISSLIPLDGLKLSHNKTLEFTSRFWGNLLEDKARLTGLESDVSLIPFFSCHVKGSPVQGKEARGGMGYGVLPGHRVCAEPECFSWRKASPDYGNLWRVKKN